MEKNYQNNAIVKALKQAGFDDEYIEKAIKEKKILLDEESKETEGDGEGESEEDHMSKSLDSDFMKSFGEMFMKSFGETLKEMISSELNDLKKSIDTISKQPLPFKSEGVSNISFLEKSLKRDENNKIVVDVVQQRSLAKSLIEKELGSMDDEMLKSVSSEALAYLTNPDATTVGETLARHMFEKGVKLVK